MNRYKPKKCKSPAKAIREFCIECMGGRENDGYLKHIKNCGSVDCALFDFRFGHNPHHKQKLTKEQRKEKGDRLRTSLSHDKRSKKIQEFAFN